MPWYRKLETKKLSKKQETAQVIYTLNFIKIDGYDLNVPGLDQFSVLLKKRPWKLPYSTYKKTFKNI